MTENRVPSRPWPSKFVASGLNRLNAVLDYFYHSAYNPFYRSGTLAIGLLFVLLATGVYLTFFYSVSSPYESVVEIQSQVWLGRWIRALHRYATDAALIAVFFHVLQLLAQGKTWGPRTLAWVSGVLLLLALFTSAWTGYVMIWDRHGQLVALSGLKVLESLPFLSDELGQAFDGQKPLPSSFFFMNLFLHVAIPLGMFFAMWVHTARLARTVWFPIKSVFIGTLLGLILLSLVVPAVLLPKADLLSLVGRIPADWFYGYWIPLIYSTSSQMTLLLGTVGFFLLIAIPWYWRPSAKIRPSISEVDVESCTGCTQCVRDCPYEAIRMVPHPNGKHTLAEVSPVNCVSCGICTASCSEFSIGPSGRTAMDQLRRVEALAESGFGSDCPDSVVIIGCAHNERMPEFLNSKSNADKGLHYFELNCCGTLHSDTLKQLLSQAGGALLVGCAARNCMNRDGLDLLTGRLYQKRVPFLAKSIDRNRLVVSSHSDSETDQVEAKLSTLRSKLASGNNNLAEEVTLSTRVGWYLKRTVASVLLLGLLAAGNQAPMGSDQQKGLLRVSARLPGRLQHSCRELSAEEKASIPLHMQRGSICEDEILSYDLTIRIDQLETLRRNITPSSSRGELAIIVNEELNVEPGTHSVEIEIIPQQQIELAQSFRHSEQMDFTAGKIELVVMKAQNN